MHRSDSEEEDAGLQPALRSVDAAIAMSRRVIKESLDLNNRPGSTVTEPSDRIRSEAILKRYYEQEAAQLRIKASSSAALSQQVVDLQNQLHTARSTIKSLEQERRVSAQQAAAKDKTLTGKLLELEDVIQALNTELTRKNAELKRVGSLLVTSENREAALRKELQSTVKRLEDVQNTCESLLTDKSDSHKSLQNELEKTRKINKDALSDKEKYRLELETALIRLQTAENTVKDLTSQLEEITNSHIETTSKLRLQAAEEENSKLKTLHQLQDLTENHQKIITENMKIPKLEERIGELEVEEGRWRQENERLKEEMGRMKWEMEELRRGQSSEIAQKLDKLEREVRTHMGRRKY